VHKTKRISRVAQFACRLTLPSTEYPKQVCSGPQLRFAKPLPHHSSGISRMPGKLRMQFNNVQSLVSTNWWTKLSLDILPGLSQLRSGTHILPYNNILATSDKAVQGLPQVDDDLDVERFYLWPALIVWDHSRQRLRSLELVPHNDPHRVSQAIL
jgi:hypothetical protein